jgi:hypothetical protein
MLESVHLGTFTRKGTDTMNRDRTAVFFISLLLAAILMPQVACGVDGTDEEETAPRLERQLIVWTSADPEVALNMVFMYAENASRREWMDTVRLLIWGPSGKLLVADPRLQERLERLAKAGVELYACKACADGYGISDSLEELGVTVEYTGTLLANAQKDGWHVLTF